MVDNILNVRNHNKGEILGDFKDKKKTKEREIS